MAATDLYTMALQRSTQPDLLPQNNEEMNFLRPGEEEDEEVWAKIKRNWIGYLSATSPTPEVALAPNRKVVQFTGGDEDDDGVENARGQKQANDHPVSLLERPGLDGGHDRAMAAGGAGRIEQYGRRKWGGMEIKARLRASQPSMISVNDGDTSRSG
ncbi:hypothetical protein RAB80_017763 [Fusarium oxysporum f. sp. vasinfectum]|nr:hypothetical protein RAB80_017763 [Fusarium oxysporum f. sp. vasinfectum]